MTEIAEKRVKRNVSLKVLSIVVLLSFMSDVVFIDYASARLTVKKSRFNLMEEEPDTRRGGAGQPTMNQLTVDNINALLEMMAKPQNIPAAPTPLPQPGLLREPKEKRSEESPLIKAVNNARALAKQLTEGLFDLNKDGEVNEVDVKLARERAQRALEIKQYLDSNTLKALDSNDDGVFNQMDILIGMLNITKIPADSNHPYDVSCLISKKRLILTLSSPGGSPYGKKTQYILDKATGQLSVSVSYSYDPDKPHLMIYQPNEVHVYLPGNAEYREKLGEMIALAQANAGRVTHPRDERVIGVFIKQLQPYLKRLPQPGLREPGIRMEQLSDGTMIYYDMQKRVVKIVMNNDSKTTYKFIYNQDGTYNRIVKTFGGIVSKEMPTETVFDFTTMKATETYSWGTKVYTFWLQRGTPTSVISMPLYAVELGNWSLANGSWSQLLGFLKEVKAGGFTHVYDEQGRVVKITLSKKDSPDIVETYELNYDKDGKLLTMAMHSGKGLPIVNITFDFKTMQAVKSTVAGMEIYQFRMEQGSPTSSVVATLKEVTLGYWEGIEGGWTRLIGVLIQSLPQHTMNPLSHEQMIAALNLVKDEDATFVITGNVNLSDLIREGRVHEGAKIVVAENSVLTIDSVSDIKIAWIRVDGELKFSTHENTQLKVGTLVVNEMGSLHIGSRLDRVQADKTAKLIFADFGSIADDPNDPIQIGRGLIVLGQVHVFGAESSANLLPATALTAGATQVTFSRSASGWRVGDEILLVSTANSVGWNVVDQSEKVRISALSADGRTITFDRALAYGHVMPDGASPPVARMTRNVQFSSENQTDITHQGHIMIMGFADLNDASFTGLGRTTNAILSDPVFDDQGNIVPLSVQNVRGRYAVHFHRTGIDANSPVNLVKNCSLDAGNGEVVGRWGGVNHSSIVNFIDNVFHGFSGANLVGDEKGDARGIIQGNITNKSVGSTDDFRTRGGKEVKNALGQRVEDIAHKGHGIYLHGGGGVAVQGNWVFGNGNAGIIYWRLGIRDGGKVVMFPVENIVDPSILATLKPEWIQTIDGKQYVDINMVPVTCIGNVIGSSGTMITLGYNMQSNLLSDADKESSKYYSVIKDNSGFGFISVGIDLIYSSFVHLENNIVLRDNPNARARSSFTHGSAVQGNDVTANINITNLTATGWEFGVVVPIRGLTKITGGHLENVVNIEIRAPFGRDPREMHRRVVIDNVRFGFYTEVRPYSPLPYTDIHLVGGYINEDPAMGWDDSVWDPSRNLVTIKGENLDSLVVRTDYFVSMASGANPNLYFYSDFVSGIFTNQLTGYVPVIKGLYKSAPPFTGAPMNLQEGLNVFYMTIDGKSQPVMVWGDTQGPTFVPDPSMRLEMNASDLAKGFDVAGRVVDQVGNMRFENLINKHFSNLIPDADGMVKLQFDVKDRAGNISAITLELKVIEVVKPSEPVVPALPPTVPLESNNWIQPQVANAITQNQEISVQYKLAQPVTDGRHVHCSISAKPVTPETVKNISFDKVVMSFPESDGQTGSASISTKGAGTGEFYISFWGVTKDHEYDGNGIVTRKIIINPAAE